jgi:hypothetical protein
MGGLGGWIFTQREAGNMLSSLIDIMEIRSLVDMEFSIYWLLILCFIILAVLLVYITVGMLYISKRPVLLLLQGNSVVKKKHLTSSREQSNIAAKENDRGRVEGTNGQKPLEDRDSNRNHDRVTTSNRFEFSTARFVYRQLVRSKGKSLLLVAVTTFTVIALGYLQELIISNEEEVNRLYDTTIVSGEVKQKNPNSLDFYRFVGEVIRPNTVHEVINSELIQSEFMEAGHGISVVIPTESDNLLPEDWDEIVGINLRWSVGLNRGSFSPIITFNEIELFTKEHSLSLIDDIPGVMRLLGDGTIFGDFHIEYAPWFSSDSFVFSESEAIPVIIPIDTLPNINIGDIVYIGTSTDMREWNHIQGIVVGTHNRNILHNQLMNGIIVPIDALEYILEQEMGYITFRFDFNPLYNRELATNIDYISRIVEDNSAGWLQLSLHIDDEEFRQTVVPLEQSLTLFRRLYPIGILLSVFIGLGLNILLMLQEAKNAAIMRTLGRRKLETRITFVMGQLAICLLGLLIGFLFLVFAEWGFGIGSRLTVVSIYLAAVLVGSTVGAILIVKRSPLEMLQVKE